MMDESLQRQLAAIELAIENVGDWQPMLRDRFAMAALSGMMASDTTQVFEAEELAKWSYDVADAMLKAREGTR